MKLANCTIFKHSTAAAALATTWQAPLLLIDFVLLLLRLEMFYVSCWLALMWIYVIL